MYTKITAAISANRRLWVVLVIGATLPVLIKIMSTAGGAQSPSSPTQRFEK
jgi:hypothetical protein